MEIGVKDAVAAVKRVMKSLYDIEIENKIPSSVGDEISPVLVELTPTEEGFGELRNG